MATIERRNDPVCPLPAGREREVVPRDTEDDAPPPPDEPDYFFWGINELYVAP
ncbi:MAG: hypothetical protein V4475_06855 [Pseudomonadota bacterium]